MKISEIRAIIEKAELIQQTIEERHDRIVKPMIQTTSKVIMNIFTEDDGVPSDSLATEKTLCDLIEYEFLDGTTTKYLQFFSIRTLPNGKKLDTGTSFKIPLWAIKLLFDKLHEEQENDI